MNVDQLENGKTLLNTIQNTEVALYDLRRIQKEIKETNEKFNDGLYYCNLHFIYDSEINCTINRSLGNVDLLNVIIATLENQLVDFKKEFDNL